MTAKPAPTEIIPAVIGLLLLAIVALAHGPAGLAVAMATIVACWFLGSSNLAFAVLILGLLGVLIDLAVGGGVQATGEVWKSVAGMLDGLPPDPVIVWVSSSSNLQVATLQAASGLMLGAIAVFMMLAWKQDNTPRTETRQARTPAPGQRLRAKSVHEGAAVAAKGIVLGAEWTSGEPVLLTDEERRVPALVVGASGAGKTTTGFNIAEAEIDRGHALIVIDGKGAPDDAHKVIEYAKSKGRTTYLFAAGEPASVAYNPFSGADYTMMADMVLQLRQWSEDHYRIAAKNGLQLAFKIAVATGEPLDLLSIAKLLNPAELHKAIRKNKDRLPNAEELARKVTWMAEHQKEMAGVVDLIESLAGSTLAPLFDTQSGRPVLTLPQARAENAVVYVSLPTLRYEDTARAIGQIVISDICATLSQGRKPWTVVFDELTAFSGPGILHLVNQGRGFGARTVLSTQSLADLSRSVDSDGTAFTNQILASVNSLIVHRLNSPDDAELVARFVGTYLKEEVTAQVIGEIESGVGSSRLSREFHVSPDTIKESELGEAFLIVKSTGRRVHFKARRSKIAT